MFESMENLKLISSFHKSMNNFKKIDKRQTSGFIIKVKGYSDYFIDGKTLRVNEGEMIFLPKDASYTVTTYCENENLYTSINFQADLTNPKPKVYSLVNFYSTQYLNQNFSELWRFGNPSDKYKCLSLLYELISFLCRTEHLDRDEKRKYAIIEPAIKHLKAHLYDSDLKIKKLHLLCGVSDTYFRRIFQSRFNITPQEYVIRSRIDYAKSIIESGDYDSINEVAKLVGYDDAMYFSKAFKKKYGFCPSRWLE